MIHLNPKTWQWQLRPPSKGDPRWKVLGLLGLYVILGITVLGFSRSPGQIAVIVGMGMGLDMLLSGLLRGKIMFPISAAISCLSLSILLNFSLGYNYLWIPVLIAIASKYLFTLNGKHIFNPSLFGICVSLWVGQGLVSLSPAYQWFGNAETAWMMGIFIISGSLLLFITKINRHWLVISFLFFYILQTALRAYVLRNHIPIETLFIGTLTSPAFYLFTFYMITDPATSPKGKKLQIITGLFLALLDLYFHTLFSLYTFFYAAFTIGLVKYVYGHGKVFFQHKQWPSKLSAQLPKVALLLVCGGLILLFQSNQYETHQNEKDRLMLTPLPASHTGIDYEQSNILNETDPRLHHVAKWLLSVGDAVAVADVDLDGRQDLFFTQPLKAKAWKAKLHLNQGNFQFQKMAIPDLERYLDDPKKDGLPSFGLFFDYDNDGDQDLFVGFGFAPSHLFENRIIPDDSLHFQEVSVSFLQQNNTVCMAANAFDYDRDGYLDLFVSNAIAPYFLDYEERVPFNVFQLPQPAYDGDRRMFHFMHESWHNANNGGKNYLLLNQQGNNFELAPGLDLKETRWSLAIGTADFNNDGFTDLYIANDFGRDDFYLNQKGQGLERQQGRFYGDIGKDTYKGMNVSIADWDGNHREDIYISNVHHAIQAEGSLLWMNQAKGNGVQFKERATQMDILNPNRFGWGAATADLNLDGWPDIIQANGMVGDQWDKRYDEREDYWYYQMKVARAGPEIHTYADKWADIRGKVIYENERDRIYLNDEGQRFQDVSKDAGFVHEANTRGVAAVDLDNDGDADLVVTDQFGAPFVYRNEIQQRQWIGFELVGDGKRCTADAVGTKVWLIYTANGIAKVQYKEVRLVNGFSAQSEKRLLFGLGKADVQIADLELAVQWPSGEKVIFDQLQLNAYQTITQEAYLP